MRTEKIFVWIALLLLASRCFLPAAESAAATGTSDRPSGRTNESKPYVLAPNDVVEVTVYQEPDLSARATITKEGTITLPLLGSIQIGGKTAEQAAANIRDLLGKDYLVNPKVNLAIVEYTGRRFTILGEVRNPGTYKMSGAESINLLDAIATAGGYTRIGSPSKITIQRTVDEKQKIFKLNAASMAKDKNATPFEILPGDTITVGEKIF